MEEDLLTREIIGAAIEVHKQLGPGLLESVYEECLAYELNARGINFERQKPVPILYHSTKIDCGFRLDFLVSEQVILELKAVEELLPIHQAQVLTYLKLTGIKHALLINFNVVLLKQGIKRLSL